MTGDQTANRAERANAMRNLGVDPNLFRGFGRRVEVTGNEAQIMRLPVIPSPGPLQDPETGLPYFMVNLDDPFTPAVVM